jgi:hypothetical protein
MKIHEYNEMMAYLLRPRQMLAMGTIPKGMPGSVKPKLVTQGPNKGKYALNKFKDGKAFRVFLTKEEADKFGKLTKVILEEKTGKPFWPDPKREKCLLKI